MPHGKFDPRLVRQMLYADENELVEAIVLVSPPDIHPDDKWISSIIERSSVRVSTPPRSLRFLSRSSIIIIVATVAFLTTLAECDEVRYLSATTVDFLSIRA
jgi:hypothetical protein